MAAGLPCNVHILASAAITLLSFAIIMILRSGLSTTPKDVTAQEEASADTATAGSTTPTRQTRSSSSILHPIASASTPTSKTVRFEDTPTAVAQPVNVQVTTTNYTAGSSNGEASLRQIAQSRSRIDKSSRSCLGKHRRKNSPSPSTVRPVQGHDLRPDTSRNGHRVSLYSGRSASPGTVRAVQGNDLRPGRSAQC